MEHIGDILKNRLCSCGKETEGEYHRFCKECLEKSRQKRLEREKAEAEEKARKLFEICKKRKELVETGEGQLRLGIPRKYHGASLSDSGHEKKILGWLNSDGPGIITFSGKAGTGKTRMIFAIRRYLYIQVEDGAPKYSRDDLPLFLSVPSLCKHLQALGREITEEEAYIKELSNMRNILILDDLGTEKITDFIKQDLYMILNEREMWDRPTIISTNLTVKEINEKFDPRIASRIAGGTVLKFTGKDRRLK